MIPGVQTWELHRKRWSRNPECWFRKPQFGLGLHGLWERCHSLKPLNYLKNRLYNGCSFWMIPNHVEWEMVGFLLNPIQNHHVHTFEHGKPRPSFSEAGDGSCFTTCEVGFGVTRHSNPSGMIGHFLKSPYQQKRTMEAYWEIINPSTAVNRQFFGDILDGFDSRFFGFQRMTCAESC